MSSQQPQEEIVIIDSTQPESLDEQSSTNSMETTLVSGGGQSPSSIVTIGTTSNMEEEEEASNCEVVPSPTTNGNESLFQPIESEPTITESPNKRVREEQDESVTTEEQDEEATAVDEATTLEISTEEEPLTKKVKPNTVDEVPLESCSMISDTATDGSVNNTSVVSVCSEDDAELTLVYEDKERALSFYRTVFEVEVVESECVTNIESAESGTEQNECKNHSCEPDDVMIKGFKLNAKLSPKKKVQSLLVSNPRIFVPSEKLQTTLERIKGFEGACVEQSLDLTSITCPEGNKLTLVKIDV